MTSQILTQSRLKELLHYSPVTGVFTNAIHRNGGVRKGTVSGCIDRSRITTYLRISIGDKLYYAHRLAWLYVHGEFPKYQIDHIDGDGKNNAIENLRDVTCRVNSKNQRISKRNTSGVFGVSWGKRENKWVVRIMVNRRLHHVGYFVDFFDAICARKSAEYNYGFHANSGSRRTT